MTRLTWDSPQRGLITQQVCIILLPAQLPSETWEQESLSPKPLHASKQEAAVPRQSCCRAVHTQPGTRRNKNRVRVTVPKLPGIPSTGKGRDPGIPPTPSEFPVFLEQIVHQLLFKYPLQEVGPALTGWNQAQRSAT